MVRAVRRTASGGRSVVCRPDHVHLLAPPGASGLGARCDGCGVQVGLNSLPKADAERVLGEFFRYHRACRPPARPETRSPRARAQPAAIPDREALRRRAEELLEQARLRASR